MKVLVTGSSGYVASLLLPRLSALAEVEELLGLDVRPPTSLPAKLRHVPGSVLDRSLAALLARERVDVVAHLAWAFNPTHDREQMRRVDVDGTMNVVTACAEAGVPHLVYLSSSTSYGAHPDNPARLREEDSTRGNDAFAYSADKAAVETQLDRFEREHPQLGVTRARPCIVLGGRTDNFVRAILDLPVLLRVRGHDPPLQFLHEEDLASCLELLVRRRPQGAFNIAPEQTVRLSELAGLLRRPTLALPYSVLRPLVGAAWSLRLFGAPPSYLDFVRWPWVVDTTRLRVELGFTARYTSTDAVRALVSGRTRADSSLTPG